MRIPFSTPSPGPRRAARSLALLAAAAFSLPCPWSPAFSGSDAPPAVGLSTVRAQRFGDDFSNEHVAQAIDHFAFALAVGDFDGDGVDDLATGVPHDDGVLGEEVIDSGLVLVRYGAPRAGLSERLTIRPQVGSGVEEGDVFGFAIAACDFNDDGFDDLAVGAPAEDLGALSDVGAVFVFYGSAGGPTAAGFQVFTQDSPGLPDQAEPDDLFGYSLACGSFDGDLFDDLAVGSPFESINGLGAAGAVHTILGSSAGLDPKSALLFHQDAPLVDDASESFDLFGRALAVGDFDGDAFDDLAIGVPGEDEFAGSLHVLFGTVSGITAADEIYRFETDLGGLTEGGDNFAYTLAVGRFDGDGFDDLAIGIPGEDFGVGGSIGNCGLVNVLFGAEVGFDFGRTQFWSQDNILGATTSETGDLFGLSLAAGDFDRDGRGDLAVGSPGEFVTGPNDGAVVVLMGTQTGLSAERHRGIAAGFDGFPGDADQHEKSFGFSLAVGDFDDDGHADLAIGAPEEDELGLGLADTGSQTILYGSIFADGFDGGDAALWSATVP